MSKRKRKKNPKSRNRDAPRGGSPDERVVDFLTVGWMLAVMTTLACEIAEALGRWYLATHPDAESMVYLTTMLSFSATVVGLFALGLLAVVWKMRKVPPPRGIVVFSVVVCVLPIINITVRLLR